MPTTDECPDCGADTLGGRDGCHALWDELFLASGGVQGPELDAYYMQHLEKYCCSAKSYAAHLTRLCCGLERNGDPRVYAAIQRWLNGTAPIEKPAPLSFLGAMTIADVKKARSPEERARIARAWIKSVWAAYAPQHALARSWIRQALALGTVPGKLTARK